MRAARIENGKVADLWEVPSLDCYGTQYHLVAAPADVELGATYDGEKFTNPSPPIEDVKTAKSKQIEAERDAACYANVTVGGHSWQADPHSQSLIANAILLAQAGAYTPTVWRTADNVNVPVTLSTLIAIASAIAAQTQAAYATSWARKAALKAAMTVEEAEAI